MTVIELLNNWMILILLALVVMTWAIWDSLAHIFGKAPAPKIKVECACDHDETVVALEDVSAAIERLASAQAAAEVAVPEKVQVTKFIHKPLGE